MPFLVETYNELLKSGSEDVKVSIMYDIERFRGPEPLKNSKLLAYAALRPALKKLAESKSSTEGIRGQAGFAMAELDWRLSELKSNLKLKIEPME